MTLTAEVHPYSATLIRVFLIDEEVLVRAGMRILIDSWSISKVIGEADLVSQAVASFASVKPDLVVFSHNGRSTELLEDLSELMQAAEQIPLVLLTSSRDPNVGSAAVQAGARWIILKQYAAVELRTAIEKAYSVDVWPNNGDFRNRTTQKSFEEGIQTGREGPLTSREREVALLVSKGCTNRQVGSRLGITEITVRHHLTSIFNKLGIANRFELISWLYRRGIASPGRMA